MDKAPRKYVIGTCKNCGKKFEIGRDSDVTIEKFERNVFNEGFAIINRGSGEFNTSPEYDYISYATTLKNSGKCYSKHPKLDGNYCSVDCFLKKLREISIEYSEQLKKEPKKKIVSEVIVELNEETDNIMKEIVIKTGETKAEVLRKGLMLGHYIEKQKEEGKTVAIVKDNKIEKEIIFP